MSVLSAPINVVLGITNKCNLNCRHCLASGSRFNNDLTTKELLNIIKQIRELKIFSVCIFGGEPLMRKDFFKIVEALSATKASLSLNTNGTLINKATAKKLSCCPIKTYVVSLDGASADIHDSIRGNGAFRKTINGIQNLVEQKCRVSISATVTRLNYLDVKNIALLSKRLGCQKVRFNEVMYTGNADCYHESLAMTVKEKFELLDKIKNLKNKFGNFITGSIVQVVDIMKELGSMPQKKTPLTITSCGAATRKCAIRPDGWVTPCEILWEAKAGNMRRKSLYDIWHNAPIMNALRKTLVISRKDAPECQSCKYARLCYKSNRCRSYFLPGARFKRKELYCWKDNLLNNS